MKNYWLVVFSISILCVGIIIGYTNPFPKKFTLAATIPYAGIIGDCNGDSKTDGGDQSALSLELFDDDGDIALNASTGSFQGTQECDVNFDGLINAGDQSCLSLVMFGTNTCANPLLRSRYFAHDSEAIQLAKKLTNTVDIPDSELSPERGLSWRIVNGLRMIGTEPFGMPLGTKYSGKNMRSLDTQLSTIEPIMYASSQRSPSYTSILGANYKHHIPKVFTTYIMNAVFDLYNSGPTKYFTFSNECLIASLIPTMCGALADSDDNSGLQCYNNQSFKKIPIIFQTPELYGFNNIRREIHEDEYPNVFSTSTFQYVETIVHEFAHELDSTLQNMDPILNGQTTSAYKRANTCMDTYISYYNTGSPFTKTYANGTQPVADFISNYAAGLTNSTKMYSRLEDTAESMAAYILTPEYFRSRMKLSATLKNKYLYLKNNVFGGIEFRNPQLNSKTVYTFPNTMSVFYSINNISKFVVSNIKPL